MIRIDKFLIEQTSQKATTTQRLRLNYNFHKCAEDTLQRLLNAVEPFSYIQPHKHENPDKREIFLALQGRVLVIEFGDSGKILDFFILDPLKGNYGAEIASGTWHTIISLETGSVVYEVKDGPYDPIDDKNFAPWAPKEGTPEARAYLSELLTRIDLLESAQ